MNRFNRRGDVVPERRRLIDTFGTDQYKPQPGNEPVSGMFPPAASSPARVKFKADRVVRRAAARNANVRAMQQVANASRKAAS